MDFIERGGLLINKAFLEVLEKARLDNFKSLMQRKEGTVFKEKKARSVVRFELESSSGKKAFFLKRHFEPQADKAGRGLGRFLRKKRPEDAMIPVAYGETNTGSLTVTEEIYDSVSGLGDDATLEKRDIIVRIARLAARFHEMGFNHQDFYLGHIFIRPATGELFLVDLQRVQRRSPSIERWIVKDLAQFVFSAISINNFSASDLVRFGHAYLGKDKFSAADKKLIKKILAKAERISRHTVKLLKRRAVAQK